MITLSIVIPTFDEEKKILRDIEEACLFLSLYKLNGEIIVVDDGSTDRTARIAGEVVIPKDVKRTVIRNDKHRGKGAAVRTGILASKGEYLLFADAGLTIPFGNALRGLQQLQDNKCEISHGSRRLPGSVILKDQDWDRKITSRLFRVASRIFFRVPKYLTDTQCGFKLYRGDVARTLFAECMTEGFMFDIEIILRALQHEYRILEFPVEWTCDRDSRIGIRTSTVQVIKEMILIRHIFFTR